MANKPIHMSKLRQVFKLHCQGQSKLQVSTVTGLSRNTVSKYINNFIALKTTWEEINGLSDKDLSDLFCKTPEVLPSDKLSTLHKFFSESSKRLGQRGVQRIHLWLEYRVQNPEGYGRTGFYRHYDHWKRTGQGSMQGIKCLWTLPERS
jgi:transposase